MGNGFLTWNESWMELELEPKEEVEAERREREFHGHCSENRRWISAMFVSFVS